MPSLVHAQATLAGVVRDTSGAVLPGVTVEASSSALIEKTRTAVSDGTGQYRITDLPPGTYNVTFTLAGFNAVQRQGVQVTGSGVIPINAEMRIGALQETVTVTGETPIVDTQSTRREMVISAESLATLPVTRSYGTLLAAIPGITTDNTSRGAMTEPFMTFFTSNGGRANEGRMLINGLPVAASFNGGGVSTFIYDVANTDEMQVLVSGGLGESRSGRAERQPHPAIGRQRVQRDRVLQRHRRWLAVGQHRRLSAQHRPDAAAGTAQPIRCQRCAWRAHRARPAVVLWLRARLRKHHVHRRRVREPLRRRCDPVGLRTQTSPSKGAARIAGTSSRSS